MAIGKIPVPYSWNLEPLGRLGSRRSNSPTAYSFLNQHSFLNSSFLRPSRVTRCRLARADTVAGLIPPRDTGSDI